MDLAREAQGELIEALKDSLGRVRICYGERVERLKSQIKNLETELKYSQTEAQQWSDLAYQIRKKNKVFMHPFCFNCGQDLRTEGE